MNTRRSLTFLLFSAGLALTGLVLIFRAFGGDIAHANFMVLSGLGFVLSIVFIFLIRRWAPEFHSLWIVNLYYVIQFGVLLVASITSPDVAFANRFFRLRISEHIGTIFFGLLLVQLAPLLIAGTIRLFRRRRRHSPTLITLKQRVHQAAPKLAFFFVILALVRLAYPLATADLFGGLPSYFIRRISATFGLVAFFVPFLPSRFVRVKILWIFVLLITALGGMFTGGRFFAFFPVILYCFGLFAATPPSYKKRLLTIGIIIAAPVFLSFMNLLGDIRDEHGRVETTEIDSARVDTYIGEITSDSTGRSDKDPSRSPVNRLINWPNLFTLTFTPHPIPYRGTENLDRELRRVGQISLLTGESRSDLFEASLGNSPARRYGFRVSETTSVEYPVLADGWARGGPPILFLYSLILVLTALFFEFLLFRLLWRRAPAECLMTFIMMVAVLTLTSSASPLADTLRILLLNSLFVVVILVGFHLLYRQFGRISISRSTASGHRRY